jgi:hypothetical protein
MSEWNKHYIIIIIIIITTTTAAAAAAATTTTTIQRTYVYLILETEYLNAHISLISFYVT